MCPKICRFPLIYIYSIHNNDYAARVTSFPGCSHVFNVTYALKKIREGSLRTIRATARASGSLKFISVTTLGKMSSHDGGRGREGGSSLLASVQYWKDGNRPRRWEFQCTVYVYELCVTIYIYLSLSSQQRATHCSVFAVQEVTHGRNGTLSHQVAHLNVLSTIKLMEM